MNPMQLYALDAGTQALADVRSLPRERTGIFIGATGLGWKPDAGLSIRLADLVDAARQSDALAGLSREDQDAALEEAGRALVGRLDPVTEDHGVNAGASIAAGRIAMHLDLHGLHYGVDAGGASSLAALEMGVRSLRDGTVDLALVGGVSELLTPLQLVAHAKLGVLARDRLRPFDPGSEGTLLGEGAAFFALKRLDDAVDAGERIYAVIRGVAGATGAQAGPGAFPGPEAQRLAMQRAYHDAELTPEGVGFVECHAGGVAASDADELRALADFFRGHRRASVGVGSAKPLVGDLGGAGGAVALLRAVLALHHGERPSPAGLHRTHPLLDQEGSPLFVPHGPGAAHVAPGADRARAGVNALGLGGACFHAVVEAHVPPAAPAPRVARRPPSRAPIAVIGLGAIVPGADDAPAFWRSLLEGRDATREVPRSHWEIDRYFDPDPRRSEKTYTRLGCFLERTPAPEERWSIPPVALATVNPEHLLVLRATEEALADAGLDRDRRHRARTAVILGSIPVQGRRYLADARVSFREFEVELERALAARGVEGDRARAVLAKIEARYKAALPPVTEHTLPGLLGSVAAARVARLLELEGPHFAVESACSSTMAALHAAVQGLRDGAFDVAICGGVWADTPPEFLIAMSRIHGVSASGITPFDVSASGFLMGEGTGILVLQRLADAERDGRRIHALVRSVAGTSDGRGRRSIFAPSPEGESDAMLRAIADAGIAPTDLDYIECHGTGTPIGDVAEIKACERAYGKGRPRPLLVGSVKSNLGHLMSASGAPALVKTVLAVRDGLIPASLKCREPNPKIDFSAGPVKVVTTATPWPEEAGRPRTAGVNAFGLGGTNFHAVVQQYVPPIRDAASVRRGGASRPAARRVLPIAAAAGHSPADCARRLRVLVQEVRGAGAEGRLEALRRTQEEAATAGPWRIAIVAADPEVLDRRLAMLERALARGGELDFLRQQGVFAARVDPATRVAAVFPGQGPQYANMLREALTGFPELDETLGAVDREYERLCGRPLRPSFLTDQPERHVQDDEDAHCAVYAVNVALFRLFQLHGVRFESVAGQSAGEISALVASGALTLEAGLQAVRERTLAVLALRTADPGRMVGLGCCADRAGSFLRDVPGYAVVAADNGPSSCIVSAVAEAAAAIVDRAQAAGVRAEVLPVSHGYHSQLIADARPRYRAALEALRFRSPELEVVSTITGASIAGAATEWFPELLSSQFVEPVRFGRAIETLYASGTRLFLECGPKWGLSTFIGQILSARPHVAQASLHPKVGELEQLHRALACLFVHGLGDLHPMHGARPQQPQHSKSTSQPRSEEVIAPSGRLEGDLVALLTGLRDALDGFLGRTAAAPREEPVPKPAIDAPAPAPKPEAEAAPPPASAPRADPTPAAPPAPPAAAPAGREQDLQRLLSAEFVKRTGYPEDMLDLDLDLEADLGIDTVKQVAVLSAVRDELGLAPDPTFRLREANTLRKIIRYLSRRLGASGASSPAGEPASDAGSAAATEPGRGAPKNGKNGKNGTHLQALAATPPPPGNGHALERAEGHAVPPPVTCLAEPRAASPLPPTRAGVHRLLLDELVRRTGYPEDMLDLDLDLEAELGIDTVKQVAVLAAVRDALRLPADPAFRLRDANTLRKVLDYFSSRMDSPAPEHRTALATPAIHHADPRPPIDRELLASMIAAVWEGTDTCSGEIAELVIAPSSTSRGEPVIEVAPDGGGRVRVTAQDDEERLEALFGTAVGGGPAEAPPEIMAAARVPVAPESGDRIRELLGDDAEPIRWVRASGATVIVAGVRLDAGPGAPDLVARMLRCAGGVASYGWHELTGARHRLAGVERVRIHEAPAPGEDLLIHARITTPRSGRWCADVTVVSARGCVVAELAGAAGVPVGELPGAAGGRTVRRAPAPWQAFSRDMKNSPAQLGRDDR